MADKQTLSAVSAHRDFLRRFLHDVATPLSAVSLHLEAADRRVRRGADPAESLEIARAEIARAFYILDSGRELIRFEAAVPFDELVSAAVSRVGAEGVALDGSTGGFVRADPRAIGEAVEALLCNALEAQPGTPVTASLGRNGGGRLVLRIENEGRLSGEPETLFSPRAAAPGKNWGMGLARARLCSAAAGGAVRLAQNGNRVVATLELPEEQR